MRRFVRSDAYARARLVSAAFFIVFGAIVFVRTLAVAGLSLSAMPGTVLGAAMVGLGALRVRDYLARRRA